MLCQRSAKQRTAKPLLCHELLWIALPLLFFSKLLNAPHWLCRTHLCCTQPLLLNAVPCRRCAVNGYSSPWRYFTKLRPASAELDVAIQCRRLVDYLKGETTLSGVAPLPDTLVFAVLQPFKEHCGVLVHHAQYLKFAACSLGANLAVR